LRFTTGILPPHNNTKITARQGRNNTTPIHDRLCNDSAVVITNALTEQHNSIHQYHCLTGQERFNTISITARQAGTIQNIKGYATIQPLQFNITARQAGTIQNIKGYATIQPLQFNITARQAGTIQYNIKGYATIQPLQFNITARQAGTIQ
jgi:hypothetical protein